VQKLKIEREVKRQLCLIMGEDPVIIPKGQGR